MSLNWKSHLDSLTTRVRKIIIIFKTEVICRLLYFKNSLVYYALCQSIFTYCISIWGAAPKTLILPQERAQRAVLKITTFNVTNVTLTATDQRHFILSVVIFVIINLIKYATYFLFPYIYEKQKLVCFTSPSLQWNRESY